MPSDSAFIGIKTKAGRGAALIMARHNKRELHEEIGAGQRIQAARVSMNECVHGPETAAKVSARWHELVDAAGVKVRKNAATVIEVVFSLSAGANVGDERAYFLRCLEWAAGRLGGWGNVLSADIHRDEAQPHMHVLVVPLRDGKLQGWDMTRKPELRAHLDSFSREVANVHGLTLPRRLQGAQRAELARKVVRYMERNRDPGTASAAWDLIRMGIEAHPEPYAALFGIAEGVASPKRLRSFTAIMTSPGKGPKFEPDTANRYSGSASKPQTAFLCSGFDSQT